MFHATRGSKPYWLNTWLWMRVTLCFFSTFETAGRSTPFSGSSLTGAAA